MIKLSPELVREVFFKTQPIRINFDNKQQMRDYMLYYRRSGPAFRAEYKPAQRAIIALTLMCWPKRKIMSRSNPQITDWQIKALNKKLPCLMKIKRALARLSESERCDAMSFVYSALDLNGDILRREE